MNPLRFEEAVVRSRSGRTLLGPITLTVEPGEPLAVCGSTGAGKSLLLELACGTRRPDAGEVRSGNDPVHRIPPARRYVGLLTQDAALYDHLGVVANIAFGLSHRDATRVMQAAAIADCAHLVQNDPGRTAGLSGGERRRVALAKAIAPGRTCLLLDEPLAGLDPVVRQTVRSRLGNLLKASRGTALVAVHDFSDALALGRRIAILEAGQLLQSGTAEDLIDRPCSAQVAARMHEPPGSCLHGTLEGNELRLPGGRIALPSSDSSSGPVVVMIPPHAARLSKTGLRDWIVCSVERTRIGSDVLVAPPEDAEVTERPLLRLRQDSAAPVSLGDRVTIECTVEPQFIFPAPPK